MNRKDLIEILLSLTPKVGTMTRDEIEAFEDRVKYFGEAIGMLGTGRDFQTKLCLMRSVGYILYISFDPVSTPITPMPKVSMHTDPPKRMSIQSIRLPHRVYTFNLRREDVTPELLAIAKQKM